MGGSLDVAGVVGTWVAVGLAILALIGIITPWLLLREASSERFKVLNTIDAQETGFITGGFGLRAGSKYFQKVRIPLLQDPPSPGLRIRLQESSALSIQTLGSATAWVNLAAIINAYAPDLKRGDQLLISQHDSFLPVHRFWILAMGLLGRYGKREDFGRAINNSNAMRLMIEGHRNFNRDSRELYSGLTGMLFWFPMIQELASMTSVRDTVYFKLHSIESRETLFPDPMPLSLLFWLALGCLPLGEDRVFDLAKYRPSLRSQRPNRSSEQGPQFFRYKERSSIRAGQSHWASSMGIDISRLWCSEKIKTPEDADYIIASAEVERGEWFLHVRSGPSLLSRWSHSSSSGSSSSSSSPPPSTPSQRLFWKTDVHCLALGIITIPISPLGFLFDNSRTLHADLFGLAADCLPALTQWVRRHRQQLNFSDEDMTPVLVLLKIKAGAGFGRRRAQAHFALDRVLDKWPWAIPEHSRRIISVLASTSTRFRQSLISALDESNLSPSPPSSPASLAHSSSSQTAAPITFLSSLTFNFTTKTITIHLNHGEKPPPARDTEIIQSFDFPSIVTSAPHNGIETYPFIDHAHDIAMATLHAINRCAYMQASLESSDLISLIRQMNDVVYVSAKLEHPRTDFYRTADANAEDSDGSISNDDDDDDVDSYRSNYASVDGSDTTSSDVEVIEAADGDDSNTRPVDNDANDGSVGNDAGIAGDGSGSNINISAAAVAAAAVNTNDAAVNAVDAIDGTAHIHSHVQPADPGANSSNAHDTVGRNNNHVDK